MDRFLFVRTRYILIGRSGIDFIIYLGSIFFKSSIPDIMLSVRDRYFDASGIGFHSSMRYGIFLFTMIDVFHLSSSFSDQWMHD